MNSIILTASYDLKRRKAILLYQALGKLNSTVYIEKPPFGRSVNADSLSGILSLNIKCGDKIRIVACGIESAGDLNAIKDIMEKL